MILKNIKSLNSQLRANTSKFPRYFLIDGDIPVKVDLDVKSGEVFAKNSLGNVYSPFKALLSGEEISLRRFNIANKILFKTT